MYSRSPPAARRITDFRFIRHNSSERVRYAVARTQRTLSAYVTLFYVFASRQLSLATATS